MLFVLVIIDGIFVNHVCIIAISIAIMKYKMTYKIEEIASVAVLLKGRLESLKNKASVLKSEELKALYAKIPTLPVEQRRAFGAEVNKLKVDLENLLAESQSHVDEKSPVDITAPMDVNAPVPQLLPAHDGSIHPTMCEIEVISDIFYRMGFNVETSREIDDQYHMFDSLNFPTGHPARDDYDTFITTQKDKSGEPLVAPAHTSTMQNRLLKKYKSNLNYNEPIAIVIPDRVFRNEDLDARHEHTFYQVEGIYVDKGIHAGHLIATLKSWLDNYYGKELKVRTQPFYFPFTEPSFEFAASCVFCDKQGCSVCSHTGWIELGGCGLIHPNVLKMAGIDSQTYTGFAWGFGIERLVMLKYNVEDVRYFHSANLSFLRQFK